MGETGRRIWTLWQQREVLCWIFNWTWTNLGQIFWWVWLWRKSMVYWFPEVVQVEIPKYVSSWWYKARPNVCSSPHLSYVMVLLKLVLEPSDWGRKRFLLIQYSQFTCFRTSCVMHRLLPIVTLTSPFPFSGTCYGEVQFNHLSNKDLIEESEKLKFLMSFDWTAFHKTSDCCLLQVITHSEHHKCKRRLIDFFNIFYVYLMHDNCC